jgi:hypothetical protein
VGTNQNNSLLNCCDLKYVQGGPTVLSAQVCETKVSLLNNTAESKHLGTARRRDRICRGPVGGGGCASCLGEEDVKHVN